VVQIHTRRAAGSAYAEMDEVPVRKVSAYHEVARYFPLQTQSHVLRR
jgi:hypothetical protein